MKKRIRIMVILLAICTVIAAGLYVLYDREPSFQGKRLSEWVLTAHDKKPGPEQQKALAVARQLAGQSIPLLLDWLQTPELLT